MSRLLLRHVLHLRRLRSVRRQLGRDGAVAPWLPQRRPRRPPGCDTGTTAECHARDGETRARSETTRPYNSRPSGVALASYHATNRVQTVSPRAQDPDWSGAAAPDYITNLLTLVTNIPPRSSVWLEEVPVAAGAQWRLFTARLQQRQPLSTKNRATNW